MSFKVQANERDRNPDDFCRQCGDFIPISRIDSYFCSRRCEERAEWFQAVEAQRDLYARVEG
jgi:hypothetical protein